MIEWKIEWVNWLSDRTRKQMVVINKWVSEWMNEQANENVNEKVS